MISALFSIEESSAVVEGVSTNPDEIINELLDIMRELKVGEKLFTIGLATTHMGRIRASKTPGYYLMALDINNATLEISKFKNIEKATDEYNKREMQKSTGTDVVLVSAQSFEALMHAYPNYFANVKEFMNTLTGLIKKYRGIK